MNRYVHTLQIITPYIHILYPAIMSVARQIPNRTVVTSFSIVDCYEEGHYILHVACGPCSNINSNSNSNGTPLSCALSNRCVQTYDRETLKKVHSINDAHAGQITDITHSQIASSGDSTQSPLLVTSGEDGLVKVFDLRTSPSINGKSALQLQLAMAHKAEEALSVSIGYNGALAAVGSNKGFIHFYDLRLISNHQTLQQPLGSYVDAHTDDVTKVRFQRSNRDSHDTTSILLSASEDGLACTFDTSQPSEELALRSVINVGSPLRDVGFFGPSLEGLYCLTGSETMSVWHHESAQRIADFGDIRNHLSKLAGGIPVQYLVGCAWINDELNLLAGNNIGDSVLYKVDAGALAVKKIMSGGHKGCIRSFVPVSSRNHGIDSTSIITAGEDSRLCEWNEHANSGGSGGNGVTASAAAGTTTTVAVAAAGATAASYSISSEKQKTKSGGGVIRRQKKKQTHSPY